MRNAKLKINKLFLILLLSFFINQLNAQENYLIYFKFSESEKGSEEHRLLEKDSFIIKDTSRTSRPCIHGIPCYYGEISGVMMTNKEMTSIIECIKGIDLKNLKNGNTFKDESEKHIQKNKIQLEIIYYAPNSAIIYKRNIIGMKKIESFLDSYNLNECYYNQRISFGLIDREKLNQYK